MSLDCAVSEVATTSLVGWSETGAEELEAVDCDDGEVAEPGGEAFVASGVDCMSGEVTGTVV